MFKSLHHILDVIENQPGWEIQQQFRLILTQWSEVVGITVAAHTRPTGIDRGVLSVATSSSIWAQELTFKRHLILRKLREKLGNLVESSIDTPNTPNTLNTLNISFIQPIDIKDIRFSPGQWQPRFDDASPIIANHPSYLPPSQNQRLAPSPPIPNSAPNSRINTQAWWQEVQARSSHLPLCGQCQCPTPPGEIDRWGCCALCATKKWSR